MKNVEVEGKELLLMSDEGHYAVVPVKDRAIVRKMLRDKCDTCINSYIQSLPKESDYAEDGTLIDPKKEVSTKDAETPRNAVIFVEAYPTTEYDVTEDNYGYQRIDEDGNFITGDEPSELTEIRHKIASVGKQYDDLYEKLAKLAKKKDYHKLPEYKELEELAHNTGEQLGGLYNTYRDHPKNKKIINNFGKLKEAQELQKAWEGKGATVTIVPTRDDYFGMEKALDTAGANTTAIFLSPAEWAPFGMYSDGIEALLENPNVTEYTIGTDLQKALGKGFTPITQGIPKYPVKGDVGKIYEKEWEAFHKSVRTPQRVIEEIESKVENPWSSASPNTRAKDWMVDWFNHPETVEKLRKSGMADYEIDIWKNTMTDAVKKSLNVTPFLKSGETIDIQGFSFKKPPTELYRGINVGNRYYTAVPEGNIETHELTHSAQPEKIPQMGEILKFASGRKDFLNVDFEGDGEGYYNYLKYVSDPAEIYAEIMAIRKKLKLKPGEKTPEYRLKRMRESDSPTGVHIRNVYNDKGIKFLLDNLVGSASTDTKDIV
jgi:hypothetical protein